MSNLLHNLFSRLNERGFNYCVLRGYKSLPTKIENDIDFGVLKKDHKNFSNSITKYFVEKGFMLVHKSKKYCYDQLYFYNPNKGHIHIDIWSAFHIKGKPYLNIEDLIASRTPLRGFYIPAPEFEVALSFLKELLHNQKIREDKIDGLKSQVNNNFDLAFQDRFDSAQINTFKSWITSGNTSISKNEILKQSNYRNVDSIPLSLINKFKFYFKEFKLLFARKGLLVVLVGPDGSGKTTTYNLLKNNVADRFCSGTKYFHFNFGTIPSLSKLMGKTERIEIKPEDDDGSAKFSNEVEPSYLKKFIYVFYYFFDFLLGNIKMLKLRYRNKLVVFDRYYYDYFIHDGYTRIPGFIKYFYKWFSPKPDIFFYLKADAQKIYDRKPELSVEEIKNQQGKIEGLIEKHPSIAHSVFEIETDKGSEIVELQLTNYIFKTLRNRYE